MKNEYQIGRRVVCISDDFGRVAYDKFGNSVPVRLPMINEVLTIAGLHLDDWKGVKDDLFLSFKEIDLTQRSENQDAFIQADCIWYWRCFRLLEEGKTDISVFTSLLTPKNVKDKQLTKARLVSSRAPCK